MSIDSQHGRRVFALEVGGLQYRYHSGGGTAGLSAQIASGINYTDVESIIEVGGYSSSLDVAGGVGQYSSTTVTLSVDRQRGGLGDPGIIFGRCGQRSASTRAQLTTSLTRSASVIQVNQDLTSLSYPRLFHVGSETVRAISATTTQLNVLAGRAVGNTPRQTHSITLEGSSVPEITTEITTFRGRRAKLYAAHQHPSGSLSSWVEVVNGFIESSPVIERQDAISISLIPLTALVDSQLGDKGVGQTSLLDGYHYFGTDANMLEYGLGWHKKASNYQIDTTSTLTTSTLSVLKGGNNTLVTDFDPSLPNGSIDNNAVGVPHPRFPLLNAVGEVRNKGAYPTSITATTNAGGDTIFTCALSAQTESYTTAELSDLSHLTIDFPAVLVELKQHSLGESELKQWPDIINSTLLNSGPTSISGLSGGWARWTINGDSSIRASKNTSSNYEVEVFTWSDKGRFMLDMQRRGLGNWQNARCWKNADQAGFVLNNKNRCWYPLDFSVREEDFFQDTRRGSGVFRRFRIQPPTMGADFPFQGVASSFYQLFEDRILVDSSIGLPSSASSVSFDIVVRFTDRKTNLQRDQYFTATHESTATFDGVDVGVYVHLEPSQDLRENVSFGNWSGYERVTIFRASRLRGDRPGVALLKLLESGGGEGLNGTYDVFTLGLNIDDSHIDEQSFLAVDSTSLITVDSFISGDEGDLRELVESILKLLSAAIVMRRDPTTGVSKVTLVSIGNDRSANTDLSISAGDWLADEPPYWGVYEDIVTQIEYQYDYDAIEEKYMSNVLFSNQEAITRYGGERSKITLTLPGLSSDEFGRGAGDRYAEFLPISSRIFNLLSNPLRVWRGSIATGQSIYLDVGSYVSVSSPHLKGYSDAYGVTDGVGMIRSIRQELMSEGCELEILVTGLSPVAWNVTARVTAFTADTVTVAENDFSSSAVDDVSFFKAGDVVDYVPRGDHDNAITNLTIQSIAGNVITFTGAHSIASANGTLESTTYANASATHQADAYLASSSDVINTTVDAQEFS